MVIGILPNDPNQYLFENQTSRIAISTNIYGSV
ncbi:hypothetical protein J2X61_001240 [Bacillus sp. 3255]|nr:hypothetical protein [Bacillus sp. 3255]